MLLKQDQFVENKVKQEWGIGKVINIKNQDRAEVFFQHAGYKIFVRKVNNLTPVDDESVNTTIFKNMNTFSEENKSKQNLFRDIPSSQEHFLKAYPDGFSGDKYISREREYKDEGHVLAIALLNQESFDELLQAKNYDEIVIRALKVVNKLNLLFPNEKMALKKGLIEEEAKEKFSLSLYSLLYGTDDLAIRFEGWIRTLQSIGTDKWTTATYFLFVIFPDKYMFIKPTITQTVADMCAFNIAYKPSLNWNTYSKVLELSNYLMKEIQSLEPKDMIDVQSFMWCINQQEDTD